MRKIILIPLMVTAMFLGNMTLGFPFRHDEGELISPIPDSTPLPTLTPDTSSYVKDFRLKAVKELLTEVDSPLSGETLVSCADDNHADPYVLVGISRIESTFGKKACGGNPFGWGSCRMEYISLNDSCQDVASGITTLSYYKKYQQSGDVTDLARVYCPSSSGCNTEHWIETVDSTKTDLQERELVLSIEELATLTPSDKSIRELEVNSLALKSHSETSTGITKEVIEILIKANQKALANAQHEL
ncbi:MAG: hypothetical protein H6772_05120 [Pseudomonadales bacterium]|nr:hypothetical protein [Pseudomonadales bacterium]